MKRASERQITKDDADSGELEANGDNGGSFQKAAPEVLATRRIVKARRSLASKPTSFAESGKPNPFASLSNAPAPEPKKPAVSEDSVKDSKEKTQQDKENEIQKPEKENEKKESEQVPPKTDSQPKVDSAAKPVEEASAKPIGEQGVSVENGQEEKANGDGKDQSPSGEEENANVNGTHHDAEKQQPNPQVASEKKEQSKEQDNGTEQQDNKANVSEPSVEKTEKTDKLDSNGVAKNATEETTEVPKTNGSSLFGGNLFKTPFAFGNSSGNTPLTFANAAASDKGKFEFKPQLTAPKKTSPQKEFKEAKVETGEENEEVELRTRAKLYELETLEGDNRRWKEKGVGVLKLNLHKEKKTGRLLMRTEATLRVILNTPIFKGMKFDRATVRSLRFQGFGEGQEGNKMSSYLLRFTAKEKLEELLERVNKLQESQKEEE